MRRVRPPIHPSPHRPERHPSATRKKNLEWNKFLRAPCRVHTPQYPPKINPTNPPTNQPAATADLSGHGQPSAAPPLCAPHPHQPQPVLARLQVLPRWAWQGPLGARAGVPLRELGGSRGGGGAGREDARERAKNYLGCVLGDGWHAHTGKAGSGAEGVLRYGVNEEEESVREG